MKKIASVLLVLALVMALTGAAMAGSRFKKNDRVEFTGSATAYKSHRKGAGTGAIVRKGSLSAVKSTYGDKWVELYLDSIDPANTGWFRTDSLKKTRKLVEVRVGREVWRSDVFVCYTSGGAGRSRAYLGPWRDSGQWLSDGGYRISTGRYRHVKAKASVWLHREPSLKKGYGIALQKGEKVTYLRRWALDSRLVPFLNVRYKGQSLWVSMQYAEIVK